MGLTGRFSWWKPPERRQKVLSQTSHPELEGDQGRLTCTGELHQRDDVESCYNEIKGMTIEKSRSTPSNLIAVCRLSLNRYYSQKLLNFFGEILEKFFKALAFI